MIIWSSIIEKKTTLMEQNPDEFGPQKHFADDFFNARGYTVTELPTGQGLVVVRPN